MTDRTTSIKMSADASGFMAAVDKARDTLGKYNSTISTAKERQALYQKAIDESGASTARQAEEIRKAITQMDRMAATAGKSKAELAAMKAEALGISGALSGHVKAIQEATKETDHFSLASTGARRELMVLAHELSQGNYKRFAGSLMVLGERTGGLSKVFNKTTLSIGAFVATIALSLEKTYEAAEQLAEYGHEVEHLSKTSGVGATAIQQWTYAAQTSGVAAKDASKALEAIAQAQNKAAHGNNDAQAAFAALGVSMSKLKTQSPEDTLKQVADAFATSADGASKAAVAQELFGSEGEKLIPLLNQGSDGLRKLGDAANAAGAVLDKNLIAQLSALQEHLQKSKANMDAASLSAKAQLAPAIMAVSQAFSDNASMRPMIEDFYKGVLFIFRSVASASATVVVGMEQIAEGISAIAIAANEAVHGNFNVAGAAVTNGYAHMKKQGEDYAAFMDKLWSNAKMPPVPGEDEHGKNKKQIDFSKGHNGAKKSDENALNGQLATIQTQIKELDEQRNEMLRTAKADFDTGALTYQQYYARVIQINDDAYRQEEELQRKRVELAQQKKQIAAAQSAQQELDRIEHAHVATVQEASRALEKEFKKRQDAFNAFSEQQAQGVARQQAAYSATLAAPFKTQQEAQSYQARLKLYENYQQQLLAIRQQFPNEGDEAERARRIELVKQTYQDEIAAYTQFEQQRQKIRESYGDQMQLAMRKIAGDGTTNAEAIGQAFTSVWGTASNALEQFVTTGKGSFKQFAASILDDLAKIALRMAMMQMFQSMMGMMAFSTGGSVGQFATGGSINGPGTGTSDSIPAMLSNGEFVVNAQAAGKYRSLLESINSGQAAHFATGGSVGNAPAPSGDGGGSNGVNVTVNHGSGGGLSAQDAKDLHAMVTTFVDKRMHQRITQQGGYASQIRYGQI